MKLNDRVAVRIKTIRRRRGLTQAGLAERMERSSDAISNLERGKSLPNFETLERLSEALDVPVKDFFDHETAKVGRNTPRRAALLAALMAAAGDIKDDDLELAVEQVQALAKRAKKAPQRQTGPLKRK